MLPVMTTLPCCMVLEKTLTNAKCGRYHMRRFACRWNAAREHRRSATWLKANPLSSTKSHCLPLPARCRRQKNREAARKIRARRTHEVADLRAQVRLTVRNRLKAFLLAAALNGRTGVCLRRCSSSLARTLRCYKALARCSSRNSSCRKE